jgi:CBS domain-containing protein/ribosome-associated translation inhibitor RaiA
MRLRELMRTPVMTIESTEAASSAWSQMRKHWIRHLVVTENGFLAGVISERDLGGRSGDETRTGRTVEDLMSPRVVSAEPTTTLREAANLMRGRRIGSLPVLDGDRLVGIVTATDVLDELGRGSSRPRRQPELRTLRMAASRRRAAQGALVLRRARAGGIGRTRPRKPDSETRSSFARPLPKTSKGESAADLPQVPAHIRSVGDELGPHDRAYIRRKLGTCLGKFASSIERVSVRTQGMNGSRGGIDRVCGIKVVLSGLPSVVYKSRDATLNAAVDGALAGVERAVRRAVQSRRMEPLRRAEVTPDLVRSRA